MDSDIRHRVRDLVVALQPVENEFRHFRSNVTKARLERSTSNEPKRRGAYMTDEGQSLPTDENVMAWDDQP
jgi:hypothetical protein